MPKSDTWPGGVAMETLSNMDSAGSCDSVISVNSACSDDSLEHLSAEERACLMFLEETIESIEVEEDSGLSNDELDGGQRGETTPQRPFATDAQGFQHDETGREHKSFLSGGIPTPFLLANGDASLPERACAGIAEPKMPDEPTEPPSSAVSIEHSAQHHGPPHEDAGPQTSAPHADDTHAPTTAADTREPEMSPDLQNQAADPVTDTRTPSPAAPSTGSDSATSVVDGDEGTENVPADASPGGHYTGASEMDLGLIPPPSDFMDEPSQPTTPQPEDQKDQEDPKNQLLDSTGTSARSSITPADVEDLSGQASMKTPSPVSPAVSPDPPSKPPVELPASANAPPSPSEMPPPPNPPLEAAEIKCPPAVAPKPKKLPSNIILKSHRPPGSDGTPAHPVSSSGDRLMLDPQRVRMEALRKLGLLKSEERDPGPPVVSPSNLSPGSRRSWAAPSAPLSPNPAPHVPTSTPSPLPVPTINPPPASVPVPSETPRRTVPPPAMEAPSTDPSAVQDAHILPAPAAFSDTAEPLAPPTDPLPDPPKKRSATLERSGMGLSGYMASQKSNGSTGGGGAQRGPSELRNTRARPASLGSGKDFSEAQGGGQGSHPHPHLAGEPQKLPRSHGISVVICPGGKNGEDRREALKKLGLLRD